MNPNKGDKCYNMKSEFKEFLFSVCIKRNVWYLSEDMQNNFLALLFTYPSTVEYVNKL